MKRIPKNNRVQQRRKLKFRLVHLLILCFSLAVMGSSVVHLWTLHVNMEKQLAALNQKRIGLIEQQKRFENEIIRLNTPSYIEQLAREQLGLVRHGEIIIAPKK